jgi:hypothetical protein
MLMMTGLSREPCADMAKRLRAEARAPQMSQDAMEFLIEGYAKLVESLLDPRASASGIEFAYSRLLGTRGGICRLCPAADMGKLPRKALRRWEWAETHLRDYLGRAPQLQEVVTIARHVEDGWADSIERYVLTLTARMNETEIADKIGILKGIDTVSLHLAQREVFALSQSLAIPLENTNAVKLRVRLLALFLTLHRCGFCTAFPAIQSYRRTFRIHDPVAYPWWFVDCRLTERQLNWNHRRIPMTDLDWRF